MANSGAQAWKEKFDANAYLNTFHGQVCSKIRITFLAIISQRLLEKCTSSLKTVSAESYRPIDFFPTWRNLAQCANL